MLSIDEQIEYLLKVEEEDAAFQRVIAFDQANACGENYGTPPYISERAALLEQFRLAQAAVKDCRQRGVRLF